MTHHHHKQQGGSPTVTSSSGRMALHDSPSKRKSLVYFDKEVLRFPLTASGVKSSRKIKVCNGDTQAHKVQCVCVCVCVCVCGVFFFVCVIVWL